MVNSKHLWTNDFRMINELNYSCEAHIICAENFECSKLIAMTLAMTIVLFSSNTQIVKVNCEVSFLRVNEPQQNTWPFLTINASTLDALYETYWTRLQSMNFTTMCCHGCPQISNILPKWRLWSIGSNVVISSWQGAFIGR